MMRHGLINGYTRAMGRFVFGGVAALAAMGLVTACGEVQKAPAGDSMDAAIVDAAIVDAAIVDADIDALVLPVTVTVLTTLGDGAPDLTARVLFQDPDGTVVADGAVDGAGHARAVLPRGGTVSAIRVTTDTQTDRAASITTTRGVKSGDDLTFGLKSAPAITNVGGQTMMTATFPLAMDATTYTLHTPCGFTRALTSPATLLFRDSCHGTTFDLLATTVGGSPPVPMFTSVTQVTFQSGGSFSIPVAFTPMPSFAVNMKNVPDAIASMNVSRASMINNLPVANASVGVLGDPPAGDVSVGVPFAAGFGTRSEIAITMARVDSDIIQRHELHTASLGSSASVDLSKGEIPWFTNLRQTATGATWTVVASGGSPDGMMIRWSAHWTDGARTVAITWLVAQAAELAGTTLPHLPAAYAMFDPGQQTVAVTPTGLTLLMADYDNVAGYDELRAMPETLLTTPIGLMGAFVGMPFQRRIMTASANVGP